MKTTTIILTLQFLLLTLGSAAASTHLCLHQSTLQADTCTFAGNFQGGDGSCQTTGSWNGGGAWTFVGVQGRGVGVAADNSCYAFAWEGQPYEGSQVAVHLYEWGPGHFEHRGAYLNTGVFHGHGGDHPYCYVTQIGPQGEDPEGLRVDCPVWFRVPYVLHGLP